MDDIKGLPPIAVESVCCVPTVTMSEPVTMVVRFPLYGKLTPNAGMVTFPWIIPFKRVVSVSDLNAVWEPDT